MWAVKEGAWFRDRKTFLRTYRNTCKMHEAVALAQMVDHRFLTPDHDVQASQFSDGTRTIVNFGESVYKATLDKQTCLLPQTGWIAVGPKIRQSLELMGGKPVTTIEAPGYRFSDATGTDITLRQEGRDRIIANIGGAAGSTRINLRTAQSDWDARTTQAFLLDVKGHRTSPLALAVSQQGEAILPAASEAQAYEIVCRSGGAKPFLP
jgi:hypothetical protein